LPEHVVAGGMQRLVERRLGRAPAEAMPLLQAAAIMGRYLDRQVLHQIDPAVDLERWLTQCADVAVLEVHDERWRFTHDKLREGLLTSLPTSLHDELHRKVAQAIEAVPPGSSSTAAALAFHWGAAGDYDKEAHYAILAGNASADLYVDVEARRHYTRAES